VTEQPSPRLSVVIPSLGIAPLERAVESVIASLGDAGIEGELVVAYQKEGTPPSLPSPARLVDVFPFGVSYARNRGLEEATGELVAYVDDDEVVHPQWVRGLLAAFEREPEAAGVFGTIEPLGEGFAYCRFDGTGDRVFRGARVAPWTVGTAGNMAFRRQALMKVKGFNMTFGTGSDGRAGEETDVIMRLLRAGETLLWTPEVRVYHPAKSESERLASRFPYGFGAARVLRRHRSKRDIARYLRNTAQVLIGGDRRRRREALATFRGFLAGMATRVDLEPPRDLLERAPEELRRQLGSAPLEPLVSDSYRPDPHFLYSLGRERVLHVYLNPGARLRRALDDRERIRLETGIGGLPAIEALAEGLDSLWLVESRLPGARPEGRAPERWFGRAAEWALRLAGEGMPALATLDDWPQRRERLIGVCPAGIRPGLERALELLGLLPAAHVHGDLSRRNLLLTAGSVGAVDWESCSLYGLPGLDLVFLALTAKKGEAPDASLLVKLVRGLDPPFAPLHALLARAGIEGELVRPALLVLLASWAADESRRLSELGAFDLEPVYAGLLARFGPALA
jgi:glycosyltransferase involved in cell wall biosynthesis